ncbi:MAG TPA: carboxymuconolactone decarboxylase family protein [Candidatus Acidoferrum sp.]|nr:carboxymuconolactone decarboxylase family protein [Candidatus Acidoferrum sp.]
MSTITETLFAPITIATAPEASKPALEKIQKSLGFIPNLMATFANNPTVLEGYLALGAVFEKGSFTPRERQIILLAASVENNCNYCAAAHSQIAKSLLQTPAEVVTAVRNNTPVPDAKLNALVALVRELVRERGNAKEKTIQKFLAAGYKKEQVMELLLGIALKTISNYLDHIRPLPLITPSQAKASNRGEQLLSRSERRKP